MYLSSHGIDVWCAANANEYLNRIDCFVFLVLVSVFFFLFSAFSGTLKSLVIPLDILKLVTWSVFLVVTYVIRLRFHLGYTALNNKLRFQNVHEIVKRLKLYIWDKFSSSRAFLHEL